MDDTQKQRAMFAILAFNFVFIAVMIAMSLFTDVGVVKRILAGMVAGGAAGAIGFYVGGKST